MLDFTGLPGWFGVDEDESEACMPFWYLLQEALWSIDFSNPAESGDGWDRAEGRHWAFAAQIYKEVQEVLRRKVTWPRKDVLKGWSKGIYNDFSLDKVIFPIALRSGPEV
jgi:hypothetical protein